MDSVVITKNSKKIRLRHKSSFDCFCILVNFLQQYIIMDLLGGYGDSSDEEETQNATKKRKLEESEDSNNKKIKDEEVEIIHIGSSYAGDEDDDLPPLPDMFEDKDDLNTEEERKKHQGRVRTFKHVVGNYPTFLHIPGILL